MAMTRSGSCLFFVSGRENIGIYTISEISFCSYTAAGLQAFCSHSTSQMVSGNCECLGMQENNAGFTSIRKVSYSRS
ncbi:MAG: hypothetical protein FJZ58_02515 [Chlamydiae bacterium]|nr:hypothetical protein [Chlamydiota bacterium]